MLLRAGALFIVVLSTLFAQDEELKRKFYADLNAALSLKTGAVVADIGTGDDPSHALRIAGLVGETGRVICVDVNQQALEKLKAKLPDGTKNIAIHLGKTDDPILPGGAFDAVLISNAYHEMTDYKGMLEHIRGALKPDGRIAVIEAIHETRRQADRHEQVKHHELSPENVENELRAAGFQVLNRAEIDSRSDNSVRFVV